MKITFFLNIESDYDLVQFCLSTKIILKLGFKSFFQMNSKY